MKFIDELIEEHCPSGVEFKPLVEACEILDNMRKPVSQKERIQGIYPYYGANGILGYINEFIFDGVYLLVGEDGSAITPNGNPVVTWAAGKIWVNNHAHVLRELEGTSLRFVFYALQIRDISKIVHGVPPKLKKADLQKIPIPLPPLVVQKEIVRILDSFTGLISELEAELAARRKQYEQYRDKLLTFGDDVDRLPLEKVSKKITDGMHNLPRDIEQHGDYPIISAENVSNGMVNILSRKYVSSAIFEKENTRTDVEQGDVLLTIVGAIGRTAVVKSEQRFLCQRSLCVIKPNIDFVTSHFIAYILESSQYQAYMNQRAKGAAQKGLYLAQVKKIEIPVPSLPEQERIVTILDKFDALCNDETAGLVAEIAARKKQYEYYRDRLLDFKRKESA